MKFLDCLPSPGAQILQPRMKSVTLFIPLLLAYCGTSIPFDQELTLKRPTGIVVTALPGQKMQLQYTVQNQEQTFDGYNVLISRTEIGDSEVFTMEPLTINGSVPTLLHSNADYNINFVRSVTLNRFTNVLPFEVGTTYFFRIQAHSRKGVRSEGSNLVSAVGQL